MIGCDSNPTMWILIILLSVFSAQVLKHCVLKWEQETEWRWKSSVLSVQSEKSPEYISWSQNEWELLWILGLSQVYQWCG